MVEDEVKFDEDEIMKSIPINLSKPSKITSVLIKLKIARSERDAQRVMLVTTIIILLITGFFIYTRIPLQKKYTPATVPDSVRAKLPPAAQKLIDQHK